LPDSAKRLQGTALIKLSYKLPPSAEPRHADIASLMNAIALPTARIDRRPSSGEIPFQDVYFVEVYGTSIEDGARSAVDHNSWMKEVEGAVERVEKAGGHAIVIGAW
jgi:hypothetical protein